MSKTVCRLPAVPRMMHLGGPARVMRSQGIRAWAALPGRRSQPDSGHKDMGVVCVPTLWGVWRALKNGTVLPRWCEGCKNEDGICAQPSCSQPWWEHLPSNHPAAAAARQPHLRPQPPLPPANQPLLAPPVLPPPTLPPPQALPPLEPPQAPACRHTSGLTALTAVARQHLR